MSDVINKARSSKPFNEGSAVALGQACSVEPLSVVRGTKTDDWTVLIDMLSSKNLNTWYYQEYPNIPMASGDVGSGNNAAVVINYAAEQYRKHIITGLAWSYTADPTDGYVKIEDGANTVFYEKITSKGPGFFPFEEAKEGTVNSALTITLSAGGSGVVGVVSVMGHRLN